MNRRDYLLRKFGLSLVTILFVVWLCFFTLCFHSRTQDLGFGVSIFGAFVLHVVFKCLLAIEATRRFSADRASGALEILLATPLPEDAIVDGQRVALQRSFRLPLALVALVNVLLLFLMNNKFPLDMSNRERPIFVGIFAGGLVVLVLDVWAMSWVGLEQSLRCRRHHWAVLATLGRIMLAPWVAVFLFVFLLIGEVFSSEKAFGLLIMAWLGAGALLDGIVGAKAWRRARRSFRRMAAGE